MPQSTKVSFSLDNDSLREITRLTRLPPRQNQTQVLNTLIHKGLNMDKEIERLKKREDYVLLKLLYMMRFLAGSRGEEVLKEIDTQFEMDLEGLREMIYEEGVDYVG